MNNLTPAQLKVIQTWTDQRDSLLREIGIYSTQFDELKKSTQDKGLALADLHQSIAEAKGRLAEIDALETRMRGSLATDIAELEVRKSRLQGECALLSEKLKGGLEVYETTVGNTATLQSAHDVMKDQAAIVDRVVGEIIQTSTLHTSEMKTIMTDIKAISDQVIDKGNDNIKQTGIVLEKLPKYIFELQRPIPVRRLYHPARGTVIPPGDAQ